MPKIVKLGQNYLHCLTSSEFDRIPNIALGKNGRIMTNNLLKKDPKLNQFINNETMGALDNYAKYEDMNIYITPLEGDLFNDLRVSVFKNEHKDVYFPMNVAKTKEEVPVFFRDLYNKIHKSTHISQESNLAQKHKNTKFEDFITYIDNIIERFNKARIEFVKKHIES